MGRMMGMIKVKRGLKALPPCGEGLGWGVPLLNVPARNIAQSNSAPIPRPLPHRGGRGGYFATLPSYPNAEATYNV